MYFCFKVVTLQETITCLEQDKQHWMLESQLLQMKYEKQAMVKYIFSLSFLGEVIFLYTSGSMNMNAYFFPEVPIVGEGI